MGNRFLMALLLLSTAVFATNVNNAVFEAAQDPTYHFDTSMVLTTNFKLSLQSGTVVSGNPSNLQSGDTVCSGAVIRVEPTVNARWATPNFYAVSPYPLCSPSYCPIMIDYSTVNANRNIRWLYPFTWNPHKTFAESNIIGSESQYNELGASNFYNQPVTYSDLPGVFHSNKRGGAGVFCKGVLQALDGTTLRGTTTLPSTSNFQITLTGSGTRQISTRLSDVECFAAIVKHPIDLPNQPLFFRLYYFGGTVPSIPSTIATSTVSLNVQSSAPTACNFQETNVQASGSFQDRTMIIVTMRNNGPVPINITSVSSDNACYTVAPAPEGDLLCGMLGLPNSLCPASNGFDENIAVGATKDIYVHVRTVCSVGCPTLTFSATSGAGDICGGGGGSTCGTDTVSLCGPITCEIAPPALELGTHEVGDFRVTCYDIGNNVVPCQGDNWYWSSISGGFVERTSTHALAYTTSPPGASGSLWYTSGPARCSADVTSRSSGPWYVCELDPPSAHVQVDASRNFDFTCYLNGTETAPDSAQYSLIDGLAGSTSDESVTGVRYNAPSLPDIGRLQGYGQYGIAPDIVGAVAFSNIQVVNTTGNGSNGNGGDPDGSSMYCKIGDGPLSVFPGYTGWVDIWCGPHHNETCSNVFWSIDQGSLWSQTDYGTGFTVTGFPGTSGMITATVNNDPNQVCWLPFFVGIPDCWEFT